jgi:hypothetical protein
MASRGRGESGAEAVHLNEELTRDQLLEAPVGQRVTALELFFDLVFVFAITQVAGFLYRDPTWVRLVQALAILMVLWLVSRTSSCARCTSWRTAFLREEIRCFGRRCSGSHARSCQRPVYSSSRVCFPERDAGSVGSKRWSWTTAAS